MPNFRSKVNKYENIDEKKPITKNWTVQIKIQTQNYM